MKFHTIGLISILAGALFGCQNTAEGMKEDVRDGSINASAKIKDGIDNGANIAKNAAEDLSVAAELTPRIKNAINADSRLNTHENLIDVDTTKSAVTLTGHVYSQTLKNIAGKVAQEEIIKAKAEQKLVNNLQIMIPAKK